MCGRVVCAQEGYGTCLFCGEYSLFAPGGETATMTKTAMEKEKKAKRANEEAEAKMLSVLGREAPFGEEKVCTVGHVGG